MFGAKRRTFKELESFLSRGERIRGRKNAPQMLNESELIKCHKLDCAWMFVVDLINSDTYCTLSPCLAV